MSDGAMSVSLPVTGVRRRTVATVVAVAAAVLLPQVFHAVGTAVGAGPAFAQSWLPMFLPVMLAGLLAGPAVGAVVGAASPLVAFALTGMPAVAMLPGMTVWLAACGVVAGLASARRLPAVVATMLVVLTVPVVSFVWMAVASLIAGAGIVSAAGAWSAYWLTGVPGFALQVVVVAVAAILINRRR